MPISSSSPGSLLRASHHAFRSSPRALLQRATLRQLDYTSPSTSPNSSTRSYTTGALAASPHRPSSLSPCRSLPQGSTRSFFSLPDISKLAKLAGSAAEAVGSGSGGEGQVQTDGDRQTFHAEKILPYSQEQLYHLVADVPSYSSFIPFCSSSVVLLPESSNSASNRRAVDSDWTPPSSDSQPFEVEAELKVGFGGFDEAYVSKVTGRPYESVSASAGEAALFKSLSTTWSFSPASALSPHPSTTIPSPTPSESSARPTGSPASDHSRGPTLLTIDLAFEFTNPLHRIASQAVLPKVADKMVEAFEKRCLEVYGKGRD